MTDTVPPRLDDDELARLTQSIDKSRRIVAFTGAGISTESGIPDYRGPGGVWETGKPPTIGDFRENAETRRAYWRDRIVRYPRMAAIEPNAGHRALVELEQRGSLLGVITQNIDGLHQKAGQSPTQVMELHGSSHRIECVNHRHAWEVLPIHLRVAAGDLDPRCDICGDPLRGATVLFGESLPEAPLQAAAKAAMECEVMLVIGSSLVVNPAAQLPMVAKRRGATVVIINRTETALDAIADVRIYSDAGPTMEKVIAGLSPN